MKFVLVSDSLSAASVREKLAEHNLINVKVGTFTALLECLGELWLLPNIEDEFNSLLSESAFSMTDVFWSESIKVDQRGTLETLESSLKNILSSLPLEQSLTPLTDDSTRAVRYYNHFVQLFNQMNNCRPLEQAIASNWITLADEPSLDSVELICAPELPHFKTWQGQVIEKLLGLIPCSDSEETQLIQATLHKLYQPNPVMSDDLQSVNQCLFSAAKLNKSIQPESIHWLTCRDRLQEIEVVVGMLQKALQAGHQTDELAVIVPMHSDFEGALPDMMNRVGILSSNKQSTQAIFQWDLQLVKDCLIYFQEVSEHGDAFSPMSLASIVSNPLMPWSKFSGQKYADLCFRGAVFDEASTLNLPEADLVLLKTIQCVPSDDWCDWLEPIFGLITFPKSARYATKENVRECIEELQVNQKQITQLDLTRQLTLLINQIQPGHLSIEKECSGKIQNGVLVLNESEALLPGIKHLFVVGFNQGCFEVSKKSKGVFTKSNWQHLGDTAGLQFDRTLQEQKDKQSLLKSNLSKASDSITFLLSEQGFDGSAIQPSSSLLDMALCFQRTEKVEPELLLKRASEHANEIAFIDIVDMQVNAENPVNTEALDDLELGLDLIKINKDKDGNDRTESPSSLADMLISPLAWLLNRQGLTSKGWDVQELGIALQGTIAHKVFELQFDENSPYSLDDYDQLFNKAISLDAPFLQTPYWRVERLQLKNEIEKSLIPFVEWCQNHYWEINKTELELRGELWGIPLRGFADAIFEKGDDTLILDYKKSKSDKRLKMLNKGFDLQIGIYRQLYQQMSKKNHLQVQSGYYTLNDRKVLTDRFVASDTADIEQISPSCNLDEQSENAVEQLQSRIKELRQGTIKLNSVDDQKYWNDVGIAAEYTFERHPLVKRFMKSEGAK